MINKFKRKNPIFIPDPRKTKDSNWCFKDGEEETKQIILDHKLRMNKDKYKK
jgi:hypothetical protein